MSWWDTIWGAITGASNVSVAADTGVSGAQPTTSQASGDQGGIPTANPMQLAPFITSPLQWVSHQWWRGATAGVLAATPGGKDFGKLPDAWDAAEHVTIGQAVLATPFDQALIGTYAPALDAINEKLGGNPHGDFSQMLATRHTPLGGIDVTDPAIRQQAFEQGGLGGLASWGTDVGLQFFFDPTVVAGKVARPLIAVSRGRAPGVYNKLGMREAQEAIHTAASDQKYAQQLLDANTPVGMANEVLYQNRGNYGFVSSYLTKLGVSNPARLTEQLMGAADKDEWNTMIMAARGNPTAIGLLRDQHAAVFGALFGDPIIGSVGVKGDLEAATDAVSAFGLAKFDPATGQPIPAYIAALAHRNHLQMVHDDLMERANALARGAGLTSPNDPGIFNAMSSVGFSPLTRINRLREYRAAQGATVADPTAEMPTGYWIGQTFRPVPGGPTVRKLHWMGSPVPANYVGLAGPLKQASQGEIQATARAAGVDYELIRNHVLAFDRATTPQAARDAVNAMQQVLVEQKILQHFPGVQVGSREYNNVLEVAREYMKGHNQNLDIVQDELRGGRLYDPETEEFSTSTMMEDPDNMLMPLIDFRALDDALKSQHPSWFQQVRDARGPIGSLINFGELAATVGLQVWKPLVLLRFGGTIKNVGESWLASTIYLGSLPGNPLTGAAAVAQNFADKVATHPINPYRLADAHQMRILEGTLGDAIDARRAAVNTRTFLEETLATATERRAALAAQPAPATAGARYVLQGQRAQATRAVRAAERTLRGSPIHAEIARLEIREDELRHAVADLGAKAARAPRVIAGDQPVSVGGHTFAGPLQTNTRDQITKAISGATKSEFAQSASDIGRAQGQILADRMEARAGTQVRYEPGATAGRPGVTGVRPPAKEFATYIGHYVNSVNSIWRKNPAVMRLLAGQDEGVVSDWLRNDPEGQRVLAQLPQAGQSAAEVDRYLLDINAQLHASAPSEPLIQRILAGDLTTGEAHGFLYGRNDLVPILDDKMIKLQDTHFWTKVNRVFDVGFKYLWTLPEDRLARIPLYNTIYRRQIQVLGAKYADHLDGLPTDQARAEFSRLVENAARERAQHDVTRIIYSPSHRTQIAAKARVISPFLQVTTNRFNYYGSQFLENPQNMARLFLGWNSIGTTLSQDGKQIVTVHLPGWVAKLAGIEDTPYLRFNKNSLNLINSGEPWYSPGSGPAVSIPMAEWLRNHPDDTPQWVKTIVGSQGLGIFPNNYYGNDALDLFLPAWAHRVRGAEGQDYINTQTMIYTQEMAKYLNGQRPDPPTDKEINDRANGLWMFRILGAFSLPAQPTLATGPPGQPAPPKGAPVTGEGLAAMVDIHREYLQKYGKNGDAKFLADFPQYYDFMVTLTTNPTGILPTDRSVARAKQYGDLVASLSDPKMGALVVNLAGDYGNFDADAYNWEKGRQVSDVTDVQWRGTKTDPKQALDDRIIARGWQEYTNLTKWRDSILKANGLTSVRSAGAETIAALYQDQLASIIKNTSWTDASGHQVTPWWDDFQSQDDAIYAHRAEDLARILDAPGYYEKNVAAQPWLQTAAAYLHERAQVAGILQQIAADGGSPSLRSQSNQWLADLWDEDTKRMRDADPQWADIANFKFAHDDISSVPGEQ